MKLTGFPPFPLLPGLSFQFPKRAYGERRGEGGERGKLHLRRDGKRNDSNCCQDFFSSKCPNPPPYFQQYFTEALVNLLMLILSILFPVGMMLEGLVGLFCGGSEEEGSVEMWMGGGRPLDDGG